MANVFQKAEKLSDTALGLLYREQVLGGLVTAYTVADFRGAKNDFLTVPIRARATVDKTALRSGAAITVRDLTESSVGIKLSSDLTSAVGITDEQATLDVKSFGTQVLQPQMIAISEAVEAEIYSTIGTANYNTANMIDWYLGDTDGAYAIAAQARMALNEANVPQAGRVLLVGPRAEYHVLTDKRLDSVAPEGLGQGALRDATIGRMAGFTVVISNLVPSTLAYAFHKTAFGFANVAPVVPQGAKAGSISSVGGFSVRWIADYDATYGVDRSVVTTYVGGASVEDGAVESSKATNVRAVKITLIEGTKPTT